MQNYQMYQPYGSETIAYLGYEITIPAGASLPVISGGATEEGVKEWSTKKFGSPIVGLVDAVMGNIGAKLGKNITTLTTEDIKAYQLAKGLSDDGSVGKATYASMGITDVDIYSKPYVPSKTPIGSDIPDVGGAWYQNAYFIWGGSAIVLLSLVSYGVYAYRNRDEF